MIRRDDVDASLYLGNPADWPGVFCLDPEGNKACGWNCAGTMITARHAVSAAHCYLDVDLASNYPNFQVDING